MESENFTVVEKLNMEDATELFYEKGDVAGAYNLMHPIYETYHDSEKVLDLYLPILEEYDSNMALDIIQKLKSDILISYLVQIDIYTNIYIKNDLSKAEHILNAAEKLWPDNFLLKCRRINWLYNIYKETNKGIFLDEIKQAVISLPRANTKLERTWKFRADSILEAENKSLKCCTENECYEKNIYSHLVNSSLFDVIIWSPTEEPILLKQGTDGTAGVTGKYALFGDWPQSLKADNVIIDERESYNVNGWNCYKGNDGYYYVKQTNKKYYKLESIKWRILDILDAKHENVKFLLAEEGLVQRCYYSSRDRRTIGYSTIYPNNYKYSDVRAYLNGLDGSNYNVEDFRNRGFINKAFSKVAIENIRTIKVDNSTKSRKGRGDNEGIISDYSCESTYDKIFLLSASEMTNGGYGFGTYDQWSTPRKRKGTDYCRGKSELLTRSPGKKYNNVVWGILDYGNLGDLLTDNSALIVPGLFI